MPKKSNIDSNVSIFGTRRYRTWKNGVAYAWENQVATGTTEVRKLIRDPTITEVKIEKPYTTKRVNIQWPVGRLYSGFNVSGSQYIESVGDIGQISFKDVTVDMAYRIYGTVKYVPSTNDWPVNPDLLSQAEVKAYGALRKKYKELDADSYLTPGIWYGERRETAALLRDAASTFARFVGGVRTMTPKDVFRAIMDFRADLKPGAVMKRVKRELMLMRNRLAKKQPGEVILRKLPQETLFTANRLVLAHNLGLSPMLSDLDAVYQAMLQDAGDITKMQIKAKGWVLSQDIGSSVVEDFRKRISTKTRVNSLLRYTVVLVCAPSDSDLARAERAGLANPPSLLAELTGCSFILNYFYPILDYLKAMSTPMAFEWLDGSWSVKVSHLQDVRIDSVSQSGRGTCKGFYRHLEFRRKVLSTFPTPIPPLSFRGDDLTTAQAVNLSTVSIEKARKALGL